MWQVLWAAFSGFGYAVAVSEIWVDSMQSYWIPGKEIICPSRFGLGWHGGGGFFSRGTTPGYYRRRGYYPPIVPGAIRRAYLPELTFDDIRRAGRQSWRLVNGLPVTHVPIAPVPFGQLAQLSQLTPQQQTAGAAVVGFGVGFVVAGAAAAWSAPSGEGFSRGMVAGVIAGIVGGAISASLFKWKQAMELAPSSPSPGVRPTPATTPPGDVIPPGGVTD